MSDSAIPQTVARQSLLSMGFSRQEYWSELPFLSPGNLTDPGNEPRSPHCRQILYCLSHQELLQKNVVVVQLPSHVWLFATPWTAARQASLSLTISWSLPQFMFIALVMPSIFIILWCPLCLLTSVQLFIHVWLFATPWTAARQASLSITNSWDLLKLISSESVMPSNHVILCHTLFLLPSVFPSIRVFSNESVFHIRWPNYQSSASASVLAMNIQN